MQHFANKSVPFNGYMYIQTKTNMINSSDSPFKFKNEVACESCLSFLMKWQLVRETLIPKQCHGCLKSGQHLQLDKTFTRPKPINDYFTSKIVLFSFQKNRVWLLMTLFQTNESKEKLQHYVLFGFFFSRESFSVMK